MISGTLARGKASGREGGRGAWSIFKHEFLEKLTFHMCFKQHASFNREKRQSSFLLCEVLRKSWGFHEMNNNNKKQKTENKKNSQVTYISGGRSRLTLDQKFTTHPRLSVKFTAHHTLVLVLNTWHVDEGRPSYSQRTSKSGESHAINDQVKMFDKKGK